MALALEPLGRLLVYPLVARKHAGPLTTRAAAQLGGGEWNSDLIGKLTMEFGMGSYLEGADAGQVTVRMALFGDDGERLFFQYISVGRMESHIAGETPIWLAGQIEVNPAASRYAWLNRVQILGRGMFTHDPLCQAYDMAFLGEGPG